MVGRATANRHHAPPPYSPHENRFRRDSPEYTTYTEEEKRLERQSRGIYFPLYINTVVPCIYACDPASRDFRELGDDEITFTATLAAAVLGKDLLHSIVGFNALETVARGIVTAMGPESAYDDQVVESPTYPTRMAALFLHDMDILFPNIAIHDMRGRSSRFTPPSPSQGFSKGVHELSNRLVRRFLAARTAVKGAPHDEIHWQRYHALLFRLSVLVARGLCNLYADYVLRNTYDSHVTLSSDAKEIIDEAPQVWESLTFGGTIDMRDGRAERIGVVVEGGPVFVVHWKVTSALVQRDFTALPLTDRQRSPYGLEPMQLNHGEWRRKYGDVFADYAARDVVPAIPTYLADQLMSGRSMLGKQSVDALRQWSMSPVQRICS